MTGILSLAAVGTSFDDQRIRASVRLAVEALRDGGFAVTLGQPPGVANEPEIGVRRRDDLDPFTNSRGEDG